MRQKQPSMVQPTSEHERRLGRPSRQQIEEIERRILDTAIGIFLQQGPAVPMKAIVEASGLSSKTVYARYPNKDALFLAALRQLLRHATPSMELKFSENAELRDVLRDFVLISLQMAYQPESLALHRIFAVYPGFARELTADFHIAIDRIFRQPLNTYLLSAQKAGKVRDINLEMTTNAILALVLAEPASRFAEDLPPLSITEMEARADFVTDLVAGGIAMN